MIEQLQSDLGSVVERHRLLFHAFLTDGERRPQSDILLWSEQQYFMSISLSPCFAGLYARSPVFGWKERLKILRLALEEAWGGPPGNHSSAFMKFYESIGGERKTLGQIAPLPETLAAAEGRLRLSRGEYGDDLCASILALAFANEHANLFIFSKLKEVVSHAFDSDFDPAYFDAHIKDEVGHSRALVKFALESSNASVDLSAVKLAVCRLLDLRATFFDGVLRAVEFEVSRGPRVRRVQ